MPLLFLWMPLAFGAAPKPLDLCAALQRDPAQLAAVEAAIARGAVVTEACQVSVTRHYQHWEGPEVVFGILFPPFGLAKLLFGGETRTELEPIAPLLLAVGTRNGGIVRALIAAGAPANTGEGEQSALSVALQDTFTTKDLSVVNALLDGGADPTRNGVLDGERLHALVAVPGALEALLAHGVTLEPSERFAFSDETPLERAVGAGDVATLDRLITLGAKLEGRGAPYPLAVAAALPSPVVFDHLLAAGASLTVAGPSALSAAAAKGNVDRVKLLLDRGVPPLGQPDEPALMAAAGGGHTALVQLLLERGAQANAQGAWERTALNAAAAAGDLASVKLLLAAGADPKHEGFFNHPAIEDAIEGDHPEVVAHLLDVGSPRAWDGYTAMSHASSRLTPTMLDVLVARGFSLDEPDRSGNTRLDYAVRDTNERVARLLLSRGAALGVTPDHPHTILHAATRASREEEAIALALRLGATLEGPDAEGRTPLWVAVRAGEDDSARELARLKANVKVVDARGLGLLYAAAASGDRSTFEWVISRGFSADSRDPQGRPLLFYFVDGIDARPLALLLQSGAPVDATDANGQTALFEAVRREEPYMIRELKNAGANLNHTDAAGRTALHLAVERGDTRAAEALLEAGARRDVRDGAGRTAAELAIERGAEALALLLLDRGSKGPYTVRPEHWHLGAALWLRGVKVEGVDLVRAALAANDIEMFDRLLEAKAPVDDALFESLLTSGHIGLADAVLQRLPPRSVTEWKARKKQARQERASGDVRRYLRGRVRDARERERSTSASTTAEPTE